MEGIILFLILICVGISLFCWFVSEAKRSIARRRMEKEAFRAMKERFLMDNDMVNAMKALMRDPHSYSDDR